jgi:hypothetical protein
VPAEPLFGLHNRDYPSLWALAQLAARAAAGPVALNTFLHDVTEEAWAFAARLLRLERARGFKLTALLPTNRSKPQSSEQGFQGFAIGTCEARGKSLHARGPLFLWRACAADIRAGKVVIGMTDAGYQLLDSLDGLSLRLPHSADRAVRFLEHLKRFAPSDWWGFAQIMAAAEGGVDRAHLIEQVAEARSDWSESEVATNAAGYVARSREWGLLETRQTEGMYRLTPLGLEILHSARG